MSLMEVFGSQFCVLSSTRLPFDFQEINLFSSRGKFRNVHRVCNIILQFMELMWRFLKYRFYSIVTFLSVAQKCYNTARAHHLKLLFCVFRAFNVF